VAATTGRTSTNYGHDALFYESDEELLSTAVPFLREGLESGETAVLVCSRAHTALLTDALGEHPSLGSVPRPEVYHRPAKAIAAYQQLTQRHVEAGARRVRLVGELDFGATRSEWAEWMRFEAVVNHALAPYKLWACCMYHTRELPDEVLAAAELTHPNLMSAESRAPSRRYLEPAEFMRRSASAKPEHTEATEPLFVIDELADLAGLRRRIHRVALAESALPASTVQEFVAAVSEVATNAIMHGAPPVLVRFWCSTSELVCTVTDHGLGFDDPFAGYLPATTGAGTRRGLGLWLARNFCDHLDIFPSEDGFTVRLATGRM
jgi:anti-sigma regulatory factor (Ser/Thr protein kinase)